MKKFIGLLLLIVAAVIFIRDLGGLLALLVAGALVIFGLKQWKRAESKGQTALAVTMLIIAAIIVITGVHSLFTLLICGVLTYLGWKIWKGDRLLPKENGNHLKTAHSVIVPSSFDEEWEAFMNRQNQHG